MSRSEIEWLEKCFNTKITELEKRLQAQYVTQEKAVELARTEVEKGRVVKSNITVTMIMVAGLVITILNIVANVILHFILK